MYAVLNPEADPQVRRRIRRRRKRPVTRGHITRPRVQRRIRRPTYTMRRPRTPIKKYQVPSRTRARRLATRQARRLGPGHRVVHHRNPKLRRPHYHVVKIERRGKTRWRPRVRVLPVYYTYRPAPIVRVERTVVETPQRVSRPRKSWWPVVTPAAYRAWERRAIAHLVDNNPRLHREFRRGWFNDDPAERQRLLIRQGGQGLPPGTRSTPQPGYFYQIRHNDRLFRIARDAYRDYRSRLDAVEAAELINNHRYNRGLWSPTIGRNQRWFPNGMISFLPLFRSRHRQGLTRTRDRAGRLREPQDGNSYAIIYIPRPPDSVR